MKDVLTGNEVSAKQFVKRRRENSGKRLKWRPTVGSGMNTGLLTMLQSY